MPNYVRPLNESSSHPEILIVGAGTTGLYLALILQHNGVPVRIIDKMGAPGIGQRGAVLWPRTLEVINSLGFIQEIMENSLPPYNARHYKTGTMEPTGPDFQIFPRMQDSPGCAYTGPRVFGQNAHQNLIISSIFPKRGLVIEREVELIALEQSEELVNVNFRHLSTDTVEAAAFKYVVGCDGAKSAVRKQTGLNFKGESRVQKFASGDLEITPDNHFPRDAWLTWGTLSEISLLMRPTEVKGQYAFLLGGAQFANHPEIFESKESLRKSIGKITGTSVFDDAEVPFLGPYNVNIRMTETFSDRRVFLAGDACHIHTPAGGQGLNTGIQDAYNLGWKLALAVKGLAQPALLASYDTERVPVVSTMLEITTGSWSVGTKISLESAMARMATQSEYHQLGINYRRSGVVVDDEMDESAKSVSPYGGDKTTRLLAGDRAPDATFLQVIGKGGEVMRLFTMFGPSQHTVLIFASNEEITLSDDILEMVPADLVRFVVIHKMGSTSKSSTYDRNEWAVVEDSQGHAFRSYDITPDGPKFFAIRPDGYIGARAHTAKGITEYFTTILCL